MQKRKVAILGIKGLPPRYGGFETLTNYLTLYQSKNYQITVYCGKTPKKERLKEFNGARLKYLPLEANGVQSTVYDIISIILCWFRYDTLVILGTPGALIIPFLRVFRKTNTVINFGGLEWKREKWGWLGKFILKTSESVAVRYANTMVADNQHFVNYIKEAYNTSSVLIEYGGDHVSKLPITGELKQKYPFLKDNYYLSVSRAQVDNNLHLLLECFTGLPDKTLVLISNYNNFEYGRNLKVKYKDYPNIFMVDAIYDLSVLDVIRSNCYVYIHTHTFCGSAPSLIEAMNLELPIISFKNDTNGYTTEDKAVYFSDVASLQTAISELDGNKIEALKHAMKEIADRRYSWERISKLYSDLF